MEREIIEQLTNRRRALGVTQSHLAELAGISAISIKKIETGKMNPTIKTISKLADVLGMKLILGINKVPTK